MSELIVALENIRSLYNIGAIYRTCEFFGIKTIYLIGYSGIDEREPNKIHKKLQKTSLGTIDKIHTETFETTQDIFNKYKNIKLITIEQTKSSIPLSKLKLNTNKKGKILLLFGNEVNGVQKETIEKSNQIVEIPRIGTHKSLNVTTSCGIILSYLQLGTSTNPLNKSFPLESNIS